MWLSLWGAGQCASSKSACGRRRQCRTVGVINSQASLQEFCLCDDRRRYRTHVIPIGVNCGIVVRLRRDMLAWSSLAGRLAKDFPQLVGIAVDDFSEQFDQPFPFTTDMIAAMESNMQSQAPWMNFAPFIYYPNPNWTSQWGDLVLTLDSMVFFFRNQEDGVCIGTAQCDSTVYNAPAEITEMSKMLAKNRRMLLGIYFVALYAEPKPLAGKMPTVPYDYNLTQLGLNMGVAGSTVAYGLQMPTPGVTCSALNFLQDHYCALQTAYSDFTTVAAVLHVTSNVSFPQTAVKGVATEPLTVTNLGLTDIRVTIPPSPSLQKATFFWEGGTFVVNAGQALRIPLNFAPRGIGLAQQTPTLTTDTPATLGGSRDEVSELIGLRPPVTPRFAHLPGRGARRPLWGSAISPADTC